MTVNAAHQNIRDSDILGERKRALGLIVLHAKLVERQRRRGRELREMLADRCDAARSHGLTIRRVWCRVKPSRVTWRGWLSEDGAMREPYSE
jgi:hypothetical protein